MTKCVLLRHCFQSISNEPIDTHLDSARTKYRGTPTKALSFINDAK